VKAHTAGRPSHASWALSLSPSLGFRCRAAAPWSTSNTVEVLVSDLSRRLGPPPIDVSVFDRQMGSTGDWAKKWIGPTSDQAPYKTPYTSTKTATIFAPPKGWHLVLRLKVPPAP
jgi:hypothetical protein